MTSGPDVRPKVYVVSLSRSVERRKAVAGQLSRLGVDFTFVDAVDAKQVSPEWLHAQVDEAAVLRNLGKRLTGPEIGCALSHRKIYRDIVESGHCGALVLEDDVTIADDFLDALAYFGKSGASIAGEHRIYNLGILSMPSGRYLMLRRRTRQRIGARLSFVEWIVFPHWIRKLPPEPWGAFGYYLTRRTAQSLLDRKRLESAADHWSEWARRTSGQVFVSSPSVVIHPPDLVGSEIEGERQRNRTARGRIHTYLSWLYGGTRARMIRIFVKPVAERLF